MLLDQGPMRRTGAETWQCRRATAGAGRRRDYRLDDLARRGWKGSGCAAQRKPRRGTGLVEARRSTLWSQGRVALLETRGGGPPFHCAAIGACLI
jgi:hypothetical protein